MQSIKVNYITPDELYQLVDFKNIDVTKVIPGFDPSAGFILSSPAYFTPPEENQQPVIQCDTPATLPSPSSSPSPTQTESEKPFVSQVETGASLPSADRENPSAVDLNTVEPPRSSPPINTEVQEAVAKFGIVEKLSEVSPPSPQFPSISKAEPFENRNLRTEIDELSPRELEAKDQVSEDDFEGCELALDLSINMESNTELRQNLDPWYTVNVLMEDECPSVQHMTFGECPAWLTQQPNQRVNEKLSIKAFQELINTTCNSNNNNNNNNTNTVSNKGKDSSIGCSEERNGAAPISPDRDEEIENKDCSSSVYSDPDDHEPRQKEEAEVANDVAEVDHTSEESSNGNEAVVDVLENPHINEEHSTENEVAEVVTPTEETVYYMNPRDCIMYLGVSHINPNYGHYYVNASDIFSDINPTLQPFRMVPDGVRITPVPNVGPPEFLESGTEYVVDEAHELKKRKVKFANEIHTREETDSEIIDKKGLISMWRPAEIIKREPKPEPKPKPKKRHLFWQKCKRKLRLGKSNKIQSGMISTSNLDLDSNSKLMSVLKKPTVEVEEATGLRRCKSCIILDAPELKKEDERPKIYQRVTRPNSS
ncbi:hypothetical protein KGF57_001614 [Candida theae]|uniref:Uncharacterized protein n=1 Tax=Candida theae TaxID=1198502 RepID=A0AAD5BGK0_9ASCO|nr:uncharacterized protein KGF57_001614 [Candida theae]KAI5961680.1 hypothetical protein KGF57_001614 [Candida theae]